MNWKDELKSRWYLHNPGKGSNHPLVSFTTCEEEVIEFITALLKKQKDEIEKEYNVGEHYGPYFGWCDVEGCEGEGCSGGNAWRDSGYWTMCSKHAQDHRDGKPQPKMKQKVIDKENSRDPDTGYLPSVK